MSHYVLILSVGGLPPQFSPRHPCSVPYGSVGTAAASELSDAGKMSITIGSALPVVAPY